MQHILKLETISQQPDSNVNPTNVKLETTDPTENHESSYSTKNQSTHLCHILKFENEEATNNSDSSNHNLEIVSDESNDSQSDTSEPEVIDNSLEEEEIESKLAKNTSGQKMLTSKLLQNIRPLSKFDLKCKRSADIIWAIRHMNRIIKKNNSVSSTSGQIYHIQTISPKDSGVYKIDCLICKKFCVQKSAKSGSSFLETLYYWQSKLKSNHPLKTELMRRHFEEEHPNIPRIKRLNFCEVTLIDKLSQPNQEDGTEFLSLSQLLTSWEEKLRPEIYNKQVREYKSNVDPHIQSVSSTIEIEGQTYKTKKLKSSDFGVYRVSLITVQRHNF